MWAFFLTLLLGVVAVHYLAVVHCLLPSPLTSLASFVYISSSVALVPAVADWVLVVPCLVLSVLQSVALVVLHSSWPWTMFHLSMLCSASSSVDCVQGCEVSPRSLLLYRRVCGLLFFCNPQACPLALDIVGLACMLLCAWLCGVSPNVLDCCMSHCAPSFPKVMGWVILLLWFLVVCHVRQACSWVMFLCCSQVGRKYVPSLARSFASNEFGWVIVGC